MKDLSQTTFGARVRPMKDEDFAGLHVSQAALKKKAKSLFPDDFDPEANLDIMPVVFELAIVNKFNDNGDGISSKDAIAMVKRFAHKPFNTEHKKHKIIGHLVNASFASEELSFADNNVEDYEDEEDPFYIIAAGFVYSKIFPKLAEAIEEAADPKSEEYQSICTSWEVAFKDFDIYVGSDLVKEAKKVSDADKEKYKKYLKAFGGKGVTEDGVKVCRLLKGAMIPLGAGATYNPAADVKGIYPTEKLGEIEENDKKISLNSKKDVTTDKFDLLMNEEQFKQLMDKVDEAVASAIKKEDQAKPLGEVMHNALKECSENWKSKVEAEAEAKQKIEDDLKTLKEEYEKSSKELKELKSEVEAQAAVELFNSRMNFVESTYELSEEETKVVTSELKSVANTDEAFETFKNKLAVVFASKSKEAIAEQEKKVQERIDAAVAEKLKESNASANTEEGEETEEEEELETEEESSATVPNNNGEGSNGESLLDRLKKNFQVEVSN